MNPREPDPCGSSENNLLLSDFDLRDEGKGCFPRVQNNERTIYLALVSNAKINSHVDVQCMIGMLKGVSGRNPITILISIQ